MSAAIVAALGGAVTELTTVITDFLPEILLVTGGLIGLGVGYRLVKKMIGRKA